MAGGSDKPARAVFDRFADATYPWANQEFFNKLTAFAQLNSEAAADAQIRFIGIDALRSEVAPLEAVLQTAGKIPANLDDSASAQAINRALLERAISAGSEGRHEAMGLNMNLLAEMPGFEAARFVGLWGTFHSSEAPINGVQTFAMWLQDSTAKYADDVVTINYVCTSQCYNLMPKAGLPGPLHGPENSDYSVLPMYMVNPYVQRLRGVEDIVEVMAEENAELALLSTHAQDSPYVLETDFLTGYSATYRSSTLGKSKDMMFRLVNCASWFPIGPRN